MTIAEALKQKMDDCGWTQYRLAKETGMAESTVHRLLKGQRKAGILSSRRIVRRFPDLAAIVLTHTEEVAA